MENFQDRGVWIRIRSLKNAWIRIRIQFVLRGWIRIRFVLRGWIRIRSKSELIRNPRRDTSKLLIILKKKIKKTRNPDLSHVIKYFCVTQPLTHFQWINNIFWPMSNPLGCLFKLIPVSYYFYNKKEQTVADIA